MSMMEHWHVAGGLAGYGPDGETGYGTATTWPELADLLAEGLKTTADYLYEGAAGTAEHDKAEAWDLRKESDDASALALNFSNERASAPLYAGNPDAWDATVEQLARDNFPYYYDHTVGPGMGARLGLYAWPCGSGETCEHLVSED